MDSQSYLLASSYDEFSWHLIPSLVKNKTYTIITIKTDIKPPNDDEVLNLSINIPAIIRIDRVRLFIETLQDIAFAGATSIIAWFGLAHKLSPPQISWPFWIGAVVAILYIIGFLLKIFLQWFYGM